jgi:hypothetical protein
MSEPKSARWTIMLYMNAEPEGFDINFIRNHKEMTAIGSTPEVNIVIIVDRGRPKASSSSVEKKYIYPSIYKIENGKDITTDTEPLKVIKNETFGSGQVLQEFLSFCRNKFPAEKNMLIFWDHGTGPALSASPEEELAVQQAIEELSAAGNKVATNFFKGLTENLNYLNKKRVPVGSLFKYPTSPQKSNVYKSLKIDQKITEVEVEEDYLYITEVRDAIKKADIKIDVVAYDACWMQMIENVYTLKKSTDFIVASENLISFQGLGFYLFTKYLVQSPEMSPFEACKTLIKSSALKTADDIDALTNPGIINEYYYSKVYNEVRFTLSCIDVHKVDQLANKIDLFATILTENMEEFFQSIRNARFLTLSFFDEEDPSGFDLQVVDLIYFTKKLLSIIIPESEKAIGERATTYNNLIRAAYDIIEFSAMELVVYNEMGTVMHEEKSTEKRWGTHGYSIFFPEHLFQWEEFKETEGWYFEESEKLKMPFAKRKWKGLLENYFNCLNQTFNHGSL